MRTISYLFLICFMMESIHLTVCLIRHKRRHVQIEGNSPSVFAPNTSYVYNLIKDKNPVNTTAVRLCGHTFLHSINAACERCIYLAGQERVSKRSIALRFRRGQFLIQVVDTIVRNHLNRPSKSYENCWTSISDISSNVDRNRL